MDALPSSLGRLSRASSGAGLAVAGFVAYIWLMWPAVQYGHICGHGAGELHCPACYAALAAVFLGLAAAATPARRLSRARRR